MKEIELQEYRSWIGALGSSALDDLTVLAGDRLGVSHATKGHVEIRATSHVGMLATSEVSVRVRPKVGLDNLFYMLGVGDATWRVERTPAPYAAVHDDLLTAVVRLFCRELDALTSRGVLHGYVEYNEPLLALRGRIDLTEVVRRPWQPIPVPCRFDEFVADIWLNRVLRAALRLVRQVPRLPPSVRGQVHLILQRFDGVSDEDVDLAEAESWKPGRRDRHYRIAMSLAGVILRRLSLADRSGHGRAASFTIDMNKLFEEFVGRELADRMPSTLTLEEQYATHLDTAKRLAIRPDFVVHPVGRRSDVFYVADAKYKLTEELGVIGDHYQLLSYATVFGLEEGALVYCQPADDVADQPSGPPWTQLDIRGSGIQHFVYRLDISGDRLDISDRLDTLASWLVGRIESSRRVCISPDPHPLGQSA